MLRIRLSSIVKISSLFACFLSINAGPEEIAKNSTSNIAVTEQPQETLPTLEISLSPNSTSVKIGSTISLSCNVTPSEEGVEVWWTKGEEDLANGSQISYPNSTIVIKVDSENDAGSYVCEARKMKKILTNDTIDITLTPELGKSTGAHGARVKLNEAAILSCELEGYPLSNFKWIKTDDLEQIFEGSWRNDATRFTMSLEFSNANRKDNGTYQCSARDSNDTVISSRCDLIVTEVPEVRIEFVKGVGTDKVYLNWTAKAWNDPVQNYFIEYTTNGTEKWTSYSEEIGGGNSSYVLKGLEQRTDYRFRISANNSVGRSEVSVDPRSVKTLEKDPEFIPDVSILETTNDSITINWTGPPEEMQDHVYYYEIYASRAGKTVKYHNSPAEPANIYKLLNLEYEVTSYRFNVAACSYYTRLCGGQSLDLKAQPFKSSSAGLHHAGINLLAVNLVSLYFAAKYTVA